jgi:hypothetical protein
MLAHRRIERSQEIDNSISARKLMVKTFIGQGLQFSKPRMQAGKGKPENIAILAWVAYSSESPLELADRVLFFDGKPVSTAMVGAGLLVEL